MFESALDDGDMFNKFRDFLVEDLDNCYPMLSEFRDDIHHINIPRKKYTTKKFFSDKLITFIYSTPTKFCKTEKIKGISLSTTFIENVKTIMDNSTHIHHSHITGEIIRYSHSFCNLKFRENHYKIPVIAHNLFRFEFFFLLKGLRAGFWKTRDINVGDKNPTDKSFASIGNLGP